MHVGKSALYERLLKEKDRQIDILADQIDWLRAQLALARREGVAPVPTTSVSQLMAAPAPMEARLHVSDEELDLQLMEESGQLNGLSTEQINEIIEGLGLAPEFDLDNITVQ